MDIELDRLRQENARLKKEKEQILEERNRYLAQIQEERTKNAQISNRALALDSEKNDIQRARDELNEELTILKVRTEKDCQTHPLSFPQTVPQPV